MIKSKKALSIVLNSIRALGKEKINLISSLYRISAEDIYVRCNVPPFDNSAMDGYALQSTDVRGASWESPLVLKVIDDVRAGYVSKKRLRKKQAIRIMTGAPIPKGADSVVMVEFTQKFKTEEGEFVRIFRATKFKENIRAKGEDVKRGEKVLLKGSLIRPQEMGRLASLGINTLRVAKNPQIGILTTGDELTEIGQRLAKGKIRNSSAYCLIGQVLALGATPVNLGIARDSKKEVRRKIIKGINKNIDLLLVSGGVSVGDYDLVKDVLVELGTEIKFWKVAMRPGKPLLFGLISSKGEPTSDGKGIPIFGLPGNPVSSMVTFEIFVRPAILKMLGQATDSRKEVDAILEEDIKKKKGFRYFLRAQTRWKNGAYFTHTTGPQGSGILKSMVLANSLIIVPEEEEFVEKGRKVGVRFLD